ncbi:sensor histidine kinase [Curtobacterium luteum]|uniref:sensor histidine kinase n=1 Tax=Curtobacterium luteum TaxID=33881 RepID=UPI003827799E
MRPLLDRVPEVLHRIRDRDPDRRVYRRSALAIGLRVAVVSAALVVSVVVLVVLYVAWQLTPGQQSERHGPEDVHVYLDTVDLLIAVLVVGGAAVLLAGVATWLIAGRAVRPLAEAHRLQRTFVADAGHELRTPLTVLSARVQQLQAMLPPTSPERAVADELRTDTRSLTEVVEDLLATAAGRTDERAEAPLDDALTAAASDTAVLARDRRVQLVVSPWDVVVRVTPTQLRRALVALVDNAVGHSPTGGAVWIENERVGSAVVIRVRDEGAGITGIAPRRVFDRFAHGSVPPDGPTRTSNGIGLALVRDIAVRAGGDVRVERTGRLGTVFALTLPIVDPLPRRGATR